MTVAGDALFRAAIEGCRQHDRVTRCGARSVPDDELRETAALCELAHRHLAARTSAWEKAAAGGHGGTDEKFWHAANALWHASREYARRHHSCDALTTRIGGHSTGALGTLALEYELEASALLALHHAVDAYRRLRGVAE